MIYDTDTGYYVLVDSEGRIGAKASVSVGSHPVSDWVDLEESFDVDSAADLDGYEIDDHYRHDQS